MNVDELGQYLRAHVEIDVQAEFDRFRQDSGSNDPELFLAYLRDRKLVSAELFCQLHAQDSVSVARLLGIRANRTLVLDQPRSTLVLDPPRSVSPAAAASAPTVIPGAPTVRDAASPAQPAAATPATTPADSHYALLGLLGAGAMGEVFVARDLTLLRKVAYKRMRPELVDQAALAARFFSEVQVTSQLDHPNIVPIYELEIAADSGLAFSMKLIQGRTLTAIIKESRELARDGKPLAEKKRLHRRLESFLKICDAVEYAHSKGVLHRDLKPDNIMIGRYSEVYVMDWGICRLIGVPEDTEGEAVTTAPGGDDGVVGHTQYGAIMGTVGYMSPEQAQGRVPELDARSDVYALGLILFELAALKPAIPEDRLERMLERASRGDKDPLAHIYPRLRIARELRAIIHKATAPAPGERYADVRQMARDIRSFLRGDAVSARPDTPLQAAQRFIGRHKLVALLVMAFLLLAAAGVTMTMLVREDRQLRIARLEEQRVQRFLLTVSRQSHAIDSHFYRYERGIARLAGRVQEVLVRPDLGSAFVYESRDYDDPEVAPPDLAPAPAYGEPISVEHPVFKLAPGLTRGDVADQPQRLAHLRPAFEHLMLETSEENLDPMGLDRERVRELIAVRGLPVTRVFTTLASGVHVSYPGMSGYPPDYDGRHRPKYTLSAEQRGINWGNPFPDRHGRGLILAASTSIYDSGGRFLGVTGLEMTFQWIIDHLLVLSDAPYVDASYLVNHNGDIVIQARQGAPAMAVSPMAGAAMAEETAMRAARAAEIIDLVPLPHPELREALGSGRPGQLRFVEGGRARLAVFYPIEALGWCYVVIADEAALLGRPGEDLMR